ncbi:hypothetical protein MGYG_05927 [Nannizzia gypsea CBS 118893]|uniref:Uncharacterized protein n=1 Tax=Arthroderma gypseum (strain ATCC MYA-4604 / CBS 118893) TaxID=535722 RepID=E4UZZ0_ARTGP|nr:hypothetical protein MGYG_05927 [Nannizzia gypsea CBS 118893]EFR02927.1 hypothetical protein MGYG_05927 [Nannizzia gypsea CBS 118893]
MNGKVDRRYGASGGLVRPIDSMIGRAWSDLSQVSQSASHQPARESVQTGGEFWQQSFSASLECRNYSSYWLLLACLASVKLVHRVGPVLCLARSERRQTKR